MKRTPSSSRQESAVSEVIGSILLVSVVVIGIAVIGVALMSHSTPEKIPALSAVISEDTSQESIRIYHDGGDSISAENMKILVDGVTQQFSKGGSPTWSTWAMGESLNYTYLGAAPGMVQIVYTGGSSSTILASSDFGGHGGSPTTATTTTTTPVQTPVANFTATPLNGTAPLIVQFTDISANSPTAWSWDFGDSTTTINQSPIHNYTAAGTYTVKLTATNAAGSNTNTKVGYITVTAAPLLPVVNFTGTPLLGTNPLTVQFTDLSTNSPTLWSWNFGDGNTTNATVQNPVHTYSSIGLYTVSLNATNVWGSNSLTNTNYVNVSVSNFTSYIVQNSVFVYGTKLNFAGSNVYGDGSTIIITSPLYSSTLNGGAQIAVSYIYIDGDVTLNTGSTGMGSQTTPGNITINGNLNLNGGTRHIYGDVYVAKNLVLENDNIHGNMYVNGDVTLAYGVPTIDTDKYIYYTGTLTYPTGYDLDFVNRCIKQTSVASVSMPSLTMPSLKPDSWYQTQGYSTSTSGTLTNNMKVIADSYTASDTWDTPGVSNIVIIARTGDISLGSASGFNMHYPVTGVLFAPNGQVTFNGNSFKGVVLAKNGFTVTSGSTTITFTSLANYFSSANDYPF
ncbi:PKD domain-containing protein [Methanoregula sp.]|uniref:PKD domain-containing protein n=1 Tax=Methanoregula sp. TaxID=2052170 RepID=UPI00356355E2